MTREQFKDECWTEIRHLVLNDGPTTAMVDECLANAAEHGMEISDDEREAMIAEVIMICAAKVIGATEGHELEGAPLHIILGAIAGRAMMTEMAG